MRPRTTLVLVLAAVAALAVVLLWERNLPGTDARREREGRLLPDVEVQQVQRLEIDRPAGRLVAERTQDGWRLREPVQDLADGWEVESLLRELAEAKVHARIAAADVRGGDAETGLGDAAPHALLVVDGRRVGVRIGTRGAPGGMRYARVDGSDELALVDDGIAALLDRPASELRERALFSFSTIDLRRIEVVEGGRPRFVLERREGDRWWLAEPLNDEADQGRAARIAGALAGLRAERFLERAPDDAGFEHPTWRVVLMHGEKDSERTELTVGAVASADGASRRYGKVGHRPAPFVFDAAELLEAIGAEPGELRSRRALDFATFDVRSITLERGADRLVVERVPGEYAPEKKWKAVEPADFPLDAERVDELLDALASARIVRFVTDADAAAALDTPEARLGLSFEDEDRPAIELLVGGPADGGRLARRRDRPDPFVVEAEVADRIDPERLRRADDGGNSSSRRSEGER